MDFDGLKQNYSRRLVNIAKIYKNTNIILEFCINAVYPGQSGAKSMNISRPGAYTGGGLWAQVLPPLSLKIF